MNTSLERNPNLVVGEDDLASRSAEPDRMLDARWWTGPNPDQATHAQGKTSDGLLTSLPLPDLLRAARGEILAYFDNTWMLTEALFSSIRTTSAFYLKPYHRLRHPMVFYYGHAAVLYVNKLRVAGMLDRPVNAAFERLFETGVDEMSWDDLSQATTDWPALDEVTEYRRSVYALVRKLILEHPSLDSSARTPGPEWPAWALFMGFEHERIHLETSSVLIRELPLRYVRRPRWFPAPYPGATRTASPRNELLAVDAQSVRLGKPREWPSFGWDNEYGDTTVEVPAFRASKYLVTNGEFLEFVRAGGYSEDRYWAGNSLAWRRFRNSRWPAFWTADGPQGLHRYKLRTCFELIDLPLDWPAEVNAFEARAYCAWRTERDGVTAAGYRLLTEVEHVALRSRRHRRGSEEPSAEDPVMLRSGASLARDNVANLNLAWGSPSPVDWSSPAETGFHDVFGNVWQWCEDDFNPLDGFRPDRLYEDFSTPCYDGQHTVILGGSFISTGDEASVWARFHFRPHFFQHAGFRIVLSNGPCPRRTPAIAQAPATITTVPTVVSNPAYESGRSLSEYLDLHYGGAPEKGDLLPREGWEFPARLAETLVAAARRLEVPTRRALDLGCAVGRATFELSRHVDQVLGIDASTAFIHVAKRLQSERAMSFERAEEGRIATRWVARVPSEARPDRVSFEIGDACALRADIGTFDLVLAANLLDRVYDPQRLLSEMTELVRPGGLLLLTTPFTWMESFTAPDKWIGGQVAHGTPVWSEPALKELLSARFELIEARDEVLLIREHRRKFQHIVPLLTLWQRP